jgi:hypothetical protein
VSQGTITCGLSFDSVGFAPSLGAGAGVGISVVFGLGVDVLLAHFGILGIRIGFFWLLGVIGFSAGFAASGIPILVFRFDSVVFFGI